jgi:cytochrome c oxidase subunit 2
MNERLKILNFIKLVIEYKKFYLLLRMLYMDHKLNYRFSSLSTLLFGFFLTSCIENAPMDSLDARGPYAQKINDLFWPILIAGFVICAIVLVLLILGLFIYDDKTDKEPINIEGNNTLEVVWTAIPILIIIAIAIPTVKVTYDLLRVPENAIEIEVIGQQWWFDFYYENENFHSPNILVIPVDKPVILKMRSKDVIHSFWVPKLNGKRYIVPGVITNLNIRSDEVGIFWSQCGEFCGLSHAKMRARVVVVTESEYGKWLESQKEDAVVFMNNSTKEYIGKDIFLNAGCAQCHVINGLVESDVDLIGPDLTHFSSRFMFAGSSMATQEDNLKKWLSNPPKVKPGSYMPNLDLTEKDIEYLIAFLMGLS